MSKRATALIVLILILGGLFSVSATLRTPLLGVLQSINEIYNDAAAGVAQRYAEHFNQRNTIRKLRADVALYRRSHLLSHQMATEFNALLEENNASFRYDPRMSLARAIAYANFGDINKVWLQMQEYNMSRLYGLVYNEKAAGIVTERYGKPLALLNGDHQCTYAVYIGPNKAPGIVRGQNSDIMQARYIPAWVPIHVGDDVVTSGLDQLFFSGIKVGKVLDITMSGGFQSATISPYFKGNAPDYFHVIERIR